MKLSKILALILAGVLAVSACACGAKPGDGEDTTAADTTAADETDTGDAETYDYSAGLDENGFFEGIKASEIVTLPEYKGVELSSAVTSASEEEVNAQINIILESYAEEIYEEITDRAVEDGDTLNIDYVGSVDGVEFEGGSTNGNGTVVTIGVTNYIDDFLEQLIDHMPGENFDIEVTFPKDYGKEELNGKDAIFNITINYIQGEIIETVIPELSDEIAADYGFENVDALKADIKEWLVSNQKYDFVGGILSAATCEEIPQNVLDFFINADTAQFEYYANMYGLTVDEYMATGGYASVDAYIEEEMEAYKSTALNYLAAQAIAELEGLTVTAEDITENGYDSYIETYGAPYIKQYILTDIMVHNFILDNAKVIEG